MGASGEGASVGKGVSVWASGEGVSVGVSGGGGR